MADATAVAALHPLWTALGIAGGLVFYGRFYVQWIVSEINKRSIMPIAFWYMSSCGSLMLLAYAVASQSPLGALGQNVNIVIYARNLAHIWRERGRLTKTLNLLLHGTVVLIAVLALTFVAFTWYREYGISQTVSAEEATATWSWLAVGLLGQGLFAVRFLIQWIATERKRKSVIPTVFWQISIVAASLQCATFTQRGEWVFAAGTAATILIYGRNLWFIYRGSERADTITQEE